MPSPWSSIRQLFRDASKLDQAAAAKRVRDAAPKRGRFRVNDRAVTCTHCSGNDYALAHMSMHTNAQAFLDLDWLGASAWTLTCTSCGKVELFAKQPMDEVR